MKRLILATAFILMVYGIRIGIPPVQAQPYPARPIQLIIPLVAGSALDVNGRIFAEEFGKALGTQVLPVNKPGGSLTLGTDAVAKSRKDGYTLAYTNTTAIVYARILNPEIVPYDPVKDLEPLGLHCFSAGRRSAGKFPLEKLCRINRVC
jgi:tripartite-type tricarboxylate transporter receptor subunit TctC